jgi:hypothetical protein
MARRQTRQSISPPPTHAANAAPGTTTTCSPAPGRADHLSASGTNRPRRGRSGPQSHNLLAPVLPVAHGEWRGEQRGCIGTLVRHERGLLHGHGIPTPKCGGPACRPPSSDPRWEAVRSPATSPSTSRSACAASCSPPPSAVQGAGRRQPDGPLATEMAHDDAFYDGFTTHRSPYRVRTVLPGICQAARSGFEVYAHPLEGATKCRRSAPA